MVVSRAEPIIQRTRLLPADIAFQVANVSNQTLQPVECANPIENAEGDHAIPSSAVPRDLAGSHHAVRPKVADGALTIFPARPLLQQFRIKEPLT